MIKTESHHTLTLDEAVGKEMADMVRAAKSQAAKAETFQRRVAAIISELECAAEDVEDDMVGGLAHASIALHCLEQAIASAKAES